MKRRVFEIIQVGNLTDIPSRTYDVLLVAAVAINIIIAIFETFSAAAPFHNILWVVEMITIIFFAVDYFLRIWTAYYLYEEYNISQTRARFKFIFSWAGAVDFLSCFPVLVASGSGALRLFRIIRILRVFRIHHYADPLRVIGDVIKKKKGQLLSSIFIVFILMITASLLMYNVEHEAQPEVFANAFSGLWWAVNSLLTVGYGDVVPITVAGKICGIILTLFGVGAVAIPTGILSAGFMEQVTIVRERAIDEGIIDGESFHPSERPEAFEYCPFCGKKLTR